jgi:hypothetical protein
MAKNHSNEGLDDRCRDGNGTIRRKRSDTTVEALRDTYGEDFASGFRSDAQLGTVLRETGAGSLTELVNKGKGK